MSIARTAGYTATGAGVSTIDVLGISVDAGDVLLMSVSVRSNIAVSSISDIGPDSWALVDTQCGARAQDRIEVWALVATALSAGVDVTVTLASSSNGIVVGVEQYTGANTTTPVPTTASYNTLGSNGACSGGTDNNDATGSITTTYVNSLVVAFINARNRTMTNTASWTNRMNDLTGGAGGDLITASIEERATSGAVTIGAANNLSGDADWCLIAVELADAAPDSGSVATPPAGSLRMMGVGI